MIVRQAFLFMLILCAGCTRSQQTQVVDAQGHVTTTTTTDTFSNPIAGVNVGVGAGFIPSVGITFKNGRWVRGYLPPESVATRVIYDDATRAVLADRGCVEQVPARVITRAVETPCVEPTRQVLVDSTRAIAAAEVIDYRELVNGTGGLRNLTDVRALVSDRAISRAVYRSAKDLREVERDTYRAMKEIHETEVRRLNRIAIATSTTSGSKIRRFLRGSGCDNDLTLTAASSSASSAPLVLIPAPASSSPQVGDVLPEPTNPSSVVGGGNNALPQSGIMQKDIFTPLEQRVIVLEETQKNQSKSIGELTLMCTRTATDIAAIRAMLEEKKQPNSPPKL